MHNYLLITNAALFFFFKPFYQNDKLTETAEELNLYREKFILVKLLLYFLI